MRRNRPLIQATIGAVILALALSACGGGSGGAGGADNVGAVSEADVAAAKKDVAQYEQPASTFGITEPIDAPIPDNLTYAFIGRPLPLSDLMYQQFKEASSAYGAKAQYFTTGATADEQESAFSAADAIKPDAVVVNGLDAKTWTKWADKWKKQGIPVSAAGAESFDDGSDLRYDVTPTEDLQEYYSHMADWAIADAAGKRTDALLLTIGGVPFYSQVADRLKADLDAACDSCEHEILNVGTADVAGGTVPTQVTGFLSRNPNTKYLLIVAASAATGVPAALKSAGLDDIRSIVMAGTGDIIAGVASGDFTATQIFDIRAMQVANADFFARSLAKVSTEPARDYDSVTEGGILLDADNIEEQFPDKDYTVWTAFPDLVKTMTPLWNANG